MQVGLIDGQRVPLDLVGQTGVVPVVVRHVGRLGACLGGKLAAVGGLHTAEVVGRVSHQVSQPVQQVAPLRSRHSRPVALEQGPPGPPDGTIHVGLRGGRSRGPHLAGCRVDGLEAVAIGRLAKLAIDVELVLVHCVSPRKWSEAGRFVEELQQGSRTFLGRLDRWQMPESGKYPRSSTRDC